MYLHGNSTLENVTQRDKRHKQGYFYGPKVSMRKLVVEPHICNQDTERLRQEDLKFQAGLGYTTRPFHQETKGCGCGSMWKVCLACERSKVGSPAPQDGAGAKTHKR